MNKVSIVVAAVLAVAVALVMGMQAPTRAPENDAEREAGVVLDALHHAASGADFDAYFACFHEDGVFLGTDASERWPIGEFKRYTRERFDTGTGWSYTPTRRHIDISDDGRFAWFDELLDNEKYGVARGTGALVRTGAGWKIVQYNLSFPVPNGIALEVTGKIRAFGAGRGGE